MGIKLSKSQLEESDVNEISRFVTNIGVDYKNYEATIVRSGWNGEYVVFQYENNSLDLENIGITDKAHISYINFQISKIFGSNNFSTPNNPKLLSFTVLTSLWIETKRRNVDIIVNLINFNSR